MLQFSQLLRQLFGLDARVVLEHGQGLVAADRLQLADIVALLAITLGRGWITTHHAGSRPVVSGCPHANSDGSNLGHHGPIITKESVIFRDTR